MAGIAHHQMGREHSRRKSVKENNGAGSIVGDAGGEEEDVMMTMEGDLNWGGGRLRIWRGKGAEGTAWRWNGNNRIGKQPDGKGHSRSKGSKEKNGAGNIDGGSGGGEEDN